MTVYLATRPYFSRHGDGPLMNETSELPYPGITEKGNPTNEYQGAMRYGYLSEDWIFDAMMETMASVDTGMQYTIKHAVSCVDHLDKWSEDYPEKSFIKLDDDDYEYRLEDVFDSLSLISISEKETGIKEL